MLTDEHEHAMKVWEEAFAAWDDTPADPNAMHSGDRAATAVIAREFEALEAENSALKAIQADEGEMLTIAWMDGAHRAKQSHRERITALEAENARLREALEEIMGLPGEINPSNYDHDDACELNRQFCYAYEIARAALGASHDADTGEVK